MLRLPIFGKKKLLLAFEYGLVLAETARKMKIEITPELVQRAEAMVLGEFRSRSATTLATNIVPNVLTAFELDLSK